NSSLPPTPRNPVLDVGIVTPSGQTAGSLGGECSYTVQPGDNLYRIAINNGYSLDAVRQANPDLVGDAPVLQPGQVLNLPECGGEVVSAPSEPTSVPATSDPNATAVPGGQTYTVQPGDTLLAIATRLGTTVRALQDANNLSDPNRLSVGQVLIIPAE
ncbi:MAG: LysM peptidoglycan-binding domain-containing protein, partial [Anaerolineae bacterium]|nr:LysM peptidoglycan-binding domain-containing protein [Anaerolineae bacterium]